MSKITYKNETDNPKMLGGFVNQHKYMKEFVQPGDMLFDEKEKRIIIFAKISDQSPFMYLIDITNKCFYSQDIVAKTYNLRKDMVKNYQLEHFTYIPVNQIESLNIDVNMK